MILAALILCVGCAPECTDFVVRRLQITEPECEALLIATQADCLDTCTSAFPDDEFSSCAIDRRPDCADATLECTTNTTACK